MCLWSPQTERERCLFLVTKEGKFGCGKMGVAYYKTTNSSVFILDNAIPQAGDVNLIQEAIVASSPGDNKHLTCAKIAP